MYLWARAVAKYKAALSWITPLFLFLTIFIPLVSLASQSPFHLVCFLSPRCLSCSLYIHMFSVHCPRASPFLLFAFFSDWVVSWGVGGRRKGKMEGVHTVGPQWREIIADIQAMCCRVERLIFLCFHVFVFIIFYFPYRLCNQSLMRSLASVSWKLSRVQNAYL